MAASPGEWFNSLPPVSKTWGAALFATACGAQLGVLPVKLIYLDFGLVFQKFQVWRLLTNVFFAGGFSMRFAMSLLMIARYGVQLETNTFTGRTADFLYMIIVNTCTLLLIALCIPFKVFFLSEPLLTSLIYLWSRENANANVNFMGVLSMPAFYLPWAYLFMDLLFGASLVEPLAGIVAGHVYFFLSSVYPTTMGGPQLLNTPRWVHHLVSQWASIAPNMVRPQAVPTPAQAQRTPLNARGPAAGAAAAAGSAGAAAGGAGLAGMRMPAAGAPAAAGGATFRGRSYRLDRD